MRRCGIALVFGGVMACGSVQLKGTAGDVDVRNARSVGYDRVTLELPVYGAVDWLVLVVSDADDACRVVPDLLSEFVPSDCAEQCNYYQDAVAAGGANGGEAWGMTIALNPMDEVEGEYLFDPDFQPATFYGRHDNWQLGYLEDASGCEEACRDGVAVPGQYTPISGGVIDVPRYDPDGVLKAKLDLAFGLERISGSLRAFPCDLSSWAWWEQSR